jgi:CO/xanthine dehydrogenase Mo-binding subunit
MNDLHFVGKPANNVDGYAKVMGQAKFIGDIRVSGMLYAQVLRSPLPHARIVWLDVSPALKIPGVRAAITSDDFVNHGNFGWPVKDSYILAYQKVRYVGDPIAAVAADTLEAARQGIAAIQLELEELPGLFVMNHSLDAGAPVIPLPPLSEKGNLCDRLIVRNGEPDSILSSSPILLDETYLCHHQEHAYIETEGTLAIPTEEGGVIVYSNDQSPFIHRNHLMTVLGLREDQVRVIQPPVGGSFGGKDDINYQNGAQTARLALLTHQPVRLTLTREESILASYKREAMQIHIKIGAREDGSFTAARVNMLVDSGAYACQTPLASWRASMHAAGVYRYDAVHVDTDVVYTNNSYCGAFRGFGNTEATAAIEQAVDELAERLGRDPVELRLQNCVKPGQRLMTGNILTNGSGLTDCLQWVREKSSWDQKRKEYPLLNEGKEIHQGIGVACYFHGTSLGGEGSDYSTSTITIENDRSLTLTCGLTDYGQGSRTVFTLVAAEVLGLNPNRIRMLRPDTQTAVESGPTVASRSTIMGGNSTRVASQNLNRLLLFSAADALNCTPERVARHQENYIGPNEDSLTYEQVVDHARQMGITLSAHGSWTMPRIEWDFKTGTGVPYFCYVFGAVIADVCVDTRLGSVEVSKIYLAHDAGKVIFPQGAFGQMYGGIAQGLGYGLMEEMKFNHGYTQAVNFDGYLIPTALDVPAMEGTFVDTRFEEGPYGAKNLAEPMLIGVAPAIANAVFHATGARHRVLPITYEQALLGHGLTPPSLSQRIRTVLS